MGFLVLGVAILLAAPALAAERLRVGTTGDYPPFSIGEFSPSRASRDLPTGGAGFDVEVARMFAANTGTEIEWVRFTWPELADRMRAGHFDVVMSGVTWRPERDAIGWMTRAVAIGGPCIVGAAAPTRVAVNRGGVLERWARERFDERLLLLIDDNRSLPARLRIGEVDAVVTDSFEKTSFPASVPARCEPPRDRKVYWVSPSKADFLGPRLDRWLAANERRIDALRARWLGAPAPRDDVDDLVDLIGRRLALMPAVAVAKRARGLPTEDAAQEARVLERIGGAAPEAVPFFATQIALAKRVQDRATDSAPTLDLERDLRPAIERLDGRILAALARVRGVPIARERLALLEGVLTADEIEGLHRALAMRAGAGTSDGG